MPDFDAAGLGLQYGVVRLEPVHRGESRVITELLDLTPPAQA